MDGAQCLNCVRSEIHNARLIENESLRPVRLVMDAADELDRLQVRGHPGTGKTYALSALTVRMVAELVNSGNADWSGEFRLEVDEDYLLKDSKGTYSRVVTVPANRALRLDIDYLLRGGTQLREPNLFVNVFAGTKYLGQHKVVVT